MSSEDGLIVPIPASHALSPRIAFSRIGGVAVLAHCLRTMLDEPRRHRAHAVVAVAESMFTDVRACLAAHDLSVEVVTVTGAGTRFDCLTAGLSAFGPAVSHVLVHDVRRPLASSMLRDRIREGLREGSDIVVPALGMVDSVKSVDSVGMVVETVDRAVLRSAQFPRGYRSDFLDKCIRDVVVGGDSSVVDELDYALRTGVPITVVDGDPDAFALDMPRDARLADAILSCRLENRR